VQFKEAKESGNFKPAPTDSGEPAPAEVATIGSLMAFDGAAPELINGRLAMLGFLAALGAEVASGQGVIQQVCAFSSCNPAMYSNSSCMIPYMRGHVCTASLTSLFDTSETCFWHGFVKGCFGVSVLMTEPAASN
jgi:hypothetical protein